MPLRSTEILVAEHREVEGTLEELEAWIDEFLTTQEVPKGSREALRRSVDSLDRELILHTNKEDHGLFPALEKFLSREAGPLAVMFDEHLEILQLQKLLGGGVADLEQQPSTGGPAAARVCDYGRSLIRILREHILKEERILFPFAESHLSEEDDHELVQKFAEVAAGAPVA